MVTFTCPDCGHTFHIPEGQPVITPQGPFEKMRSFQSSTRWNPSQTVPAIPHQPQLNIEEVTRSAPARPATVESDFNVVILQAAGCAMAAFLPALGLTIMYEWSWWIPPSALVGGFSISWFLLLIDTRKLLRMVETVIGRDIDGDGMVGQSQPPPRKPPLRIQVESKGGRVIQFDELPVDEDDEETMIRVATAVLQRGCNLSRRELAKETNLSEERANELLEQMRRLGYARYKGASPNTGTELTNKGRVLLEHFATLPQ